jgi:AraC-like DNA-binding protein/uncharacterized cupin superfamily protein
VTGVRYRPYHLADLHRDRGTVGAFTAAAYTFRASTRWRPVDYLEIMAVLDGEGRKTETLGPGRRGAVHIGPGDVFLVRSDTENVLEVAGDGELSIVIVSFPASDWETLAGFIGVDPQWSTAPRPPKVTVDAEHRDALRAFDTVLARTHEGLSRLDLLRFLVTVVPLLLPVHDPRRPHREPPEWLVTAIEAMQDEQNLRGGVHHLQQLAHVSAPYLSTIIRRYYGTTPSALLSEIRLRHAAMLLVTTRESVAEIAARCGYKTPEYFATCFKHAHHVSPRRYRSRFTEM